MNSPTLRYAVADPIVTRYNEDTQYFEVVVIKRKDTGEWALPGGMVDFGEEVSATVKREFREEACNAFASHLTPEQRKQEERKFDALLDDLFQDRTESKVVYKGYVDDPRNTDNAWLESVAFHFHCNPEHAKKLKLSGGDDAVSARWLRMDPAQEQHYAKLYADHRVWTDVRRRPSSPGPGGSLMHPSCPLPLSDGATETAGAQEGGHVGPLQDLWTEAGA